LDEHTSGRFWPDDDPTTATREQCVELLESVGIACHDSDSLETLRAAVVANVDDETLPGLEVWRDAVRDNSEPREVFEWWLVSRWLCEKLRELGEVVLDNDYGYWWGRCTTGQAIIADGVLQHVARLIDKG
jgi:hypothetical protein